MNGRAMRGAFVSRRRMLAASVAAMAALTARQLAEPVTAAQEVTPSSGHVPDLTGVAPLALTGELLATFEAFIATQLAALDVPGAAVAVVQGDEVAFLQGFGVREAGRPAPISADTLLRIGSVTKSFSSMLAATLVDAGRLSWDTPMIDLLPDFAVADADLTTHLTIADAFCACSGLPRRDLEFQFSAQDLTPEQVIAGMERLPLTAPFGEKFQYNNQLVAAGGFAAAVADGGSPHDLDASYSVVLRDRVLNPIGMPRSTLSLREVVEDDYAAPHAPDLGGSAVSLPLLVDDTWIAPVAPTGGLWSSAREMARYVQTELGRGVAPSGERVVSAENLETTWQPGAPLDFGPETPAIFAQANSHYALGWEAGTYGGQRLVSHTGSTYGFNSLVAFMPDAGLGLVVLTNRSGAGALLALAVEFRLFELLFSQPATIEAMLQAVVTAEDAARGDLLSHLGEVDAAAMAPFLGLYANPDLGNLTLAMRDGELVFDTGSAVSALLPRLDDAGKVVGYIFVDPPWAANPPTMWVALTEEGGAPRVVLTAQADAGDDDLVYAYQPVDVAG